VIFVGNNVNIQEIWKFTTGYTQERGPSLAGLNNVYRSSRHRATEQGMRRPASGESGKATRDL